jgi:hypothetical protein
LEDDSRGQQPRTAPSGNPRTGKLTTQRENRTPVRLSPL